MTKTKIALANLRYPATPEESIALAAQAIELAARQGARIACFPECFVPGYRIINGPVPPPDPALLDRAAAAIAAVGGWSSGLARCKEWPTAIRRHSLGRSRGAGHTSIAPHAVAAP